MLHTINIYCRFHFLYLNSRGLLSMYVTHWCLCYISFSFWLSHIDVAIAFKAQTSKLKYFLLRNFRTTKMAVRNQNIQIYHISLVNMAYCLVMIVWLLHWSNVVLSRLSSSPKYCTFRQDAIFCSLYAIKLPSLCFIGRNLEAACVRFPNAYYFLNRNLEVVWVKYL